MVWGSGPGQLVRGDTAPTDLHQAANSTSLWAEPRCSMTLSRHPSLTAICTAVAPEAVLTLRRNGLTPVHHTVS